MSNPLEATFSSLVMSLASSASISLGLVPHPETGKEQIDKNMARFNIDMLVTLKDKTQNNLSEEEKRLLDHVITDLQLKYSQK